MIDQETVDAIIAYQHERNANDDDVMFKAGDGVNPSDKWIKRLSKFFAKYGLKVKSHDFRVT